MEVQPGRRVVPQSVHPVLPAARVGILDLIRLNRHRLVVVNLKYDDEKHRQPVVLEDERSQDEPRTEEAEEALDERDEHVHVDVPKRVVPDLGLRGDHDLLVDREGVGVVTLNAQAVLLTFLIALLDLNITLVPNVLHLVLHHVQEDLGHALAVVGAWHAVRLVPARGIVDQRPDDLRALLDVGFLRGGVDRLLKVGVVRDLAGRTAVTVSVRRRSQLCMWCTC